MATPTPPRQTPEGQLLAQAMMRRRWKAPRFSSEASVSVDWVRAIIRGYRNSGKGAYEPVVPDAAMLATLAQVIGNISPEQLASIGREDAADALRTLTTPSGVDRSDSFADRLQRLRDELDALISEMRA